MFTIQHTDGTMIQVPLAIEAQGGAAIEAYLAQHVAAAKPLTPPDGPVKASTADSSEE